MRLAMLPLCTLFAVGQGIALAQEKKEQPPTASPDQKTHDSRKLGAIDILSDTQGVDFGPYLKDILPIVKKNWYTLIPESAAMKKGKLAIEFAIKKDGHVAGMKLVASSGDVALDRPAWGSITASDPFPPLPSDFKGPYLALRSRFYYNPDKKDLQRDVSQVSQLQRPAAGSPGFVCVKEI